MWQDRTVTLTDADYLDSCEHFVTSAGLYLLGFDSPDCVLTKLLSAVRFACVLRNIGYLYSSCEEPIGDLLNRMRQVTYPTVLIDSHPF